ncbi:hypothetical protein Avbf_08076 [Armadillidium vulgare]|nr:hypothetical protein Avbf_08076 [Armadillidium vulgare]
MYQNTERVVAKMIYSKLPDLVFLELKEEVEYCLGEVLLEEHSLFDPMHVLLEGLLPNNIQLLLSTLSSQGILNREALNKSIKKFEFCKNIKSSELPKPFTSCRL